MKYIVNVTTKIGNISRADKEQMIINAVATAVSHTVKNEEKIFDSTENVVQVNVNFIYSYEK